MAPVRRTSHPAVAPKIPKKSPLSSVGNIPPAPQKAPRPRFPPSIMRVPSTYRIPKKSTGALLPPPVQGSGQSCLCVTTLFSEEDEYVPEPISDVFPQPMAYEPRPVAPRAVATPVPRVSSSISASKPPLKLVKDPPATSAPSKAKKLSVPSTPVAKGPKSSAPPSKVPVPSTPGPKTRSSVKMKSKQSTELMDSSPAVEKPRRYSRTEEEAAEMVRNENKQNTIEPSPSAVSESQKSMKKPKISLNPMVTKPPCLDKPIVTKIPRLFNLCERQILQEAYETQVYDCSTDVHVPFNVLRPLLERYSADNLFNTEITMPWLESGIESIWRKKLARDFPSSRLFPLETYGEAYRRYLVEREDIR